jgi:hypothetical protein
MARAQFSLCQNCEFLRQPTLVLLEGRTAPQTVLAFGGCLLLFGHACCEVGPIEKHAAGGGIPHGTFADPSSKLTLRKSELCGRQHDGTLTMEQ